MKADPPTILTVEHILMNHYDINPLPDYHYIKLIVTVYVKWHLYFHKHDSIHNEVNRPILCLLTFYTFPYRSKNIQKFQIFDPHHRVTYGWFADQPEK